MYNSELEIIAKNLSRAREPRDIFGSLSGNASQMQEGLKSAFRKLAKLSHEDKHPNDKELARETFIGLREWFEMAESQIEDGRYNNNGTKRKTKETKITVRGVTYSLKERAYAGDISDIYECLYAAEDKKEKEGLFKIVRDPEDNDLAQNEARVLKHLYENKTGRGFLDYLPLLKASFSLKDGTGTRQANVFELKSGFYSLEEVMEQYPKGLDPRDMAWMFKRLLVVLGWAHENSVVHGAVLPSHVLIHRENHGGMLIDWSYAVINPSTSKERIKAISRDYKDMYAPEILNKESPGASTDIYMAGLCMVKLLGGDVLKKTLPKETPEEMKRFFGKCINKNPHKRPDSAWDLHKEFDDILHGLYGPRKFRDLHMPNHLD